MKRNENYGEKREATIWRMRRLAAYEYPKLWHLEVRKQNGNYVTACGLRYGIAGSAFKGTVPVAVCAKCLKRA